MTRSPLWTSTDIITATNGQINHNDWTATGVSIDTRSLAPGDLFVALSGPNHDGHDHVAAAFTAGAAAALIHRAPSDTNGPWVKVDDTVLGLEKLGQAARARSAAKIAAVTGSVGKTGTKEMLALVLGEQAPTHATQGNLNNQLGAPLSLARMPRDTTFGVFELGMNHAGELTPLTKMVRPHVVIITAIEMAHSEFFANTKAIADAKAEIFLGLEPGGVAILPRDNPHYAYLREKAKAAGVEHILSFGKHIEANARLLDFDLNVQSTSVLALVDDLAISYELGAVGQHWAMNSLAVLLAVKELGGDLIQAANRLAKMSPPKGRGSRFVSAQGVIVIDESYNASPAAMKAALTSLGAINPVSAGRRIAVLGDMLELGEHALELHAELADTIEEWDIDLVFTAGPLMYALHQTLDEDKCGAHAENSEAIVAPLLKALKPGDVVMIKGSAGSKMSKVVEALKGIKENKSAL
jgi:UDP-N-acetylmuramoyl-tripeptide--D-alanyl-D-alanine ligase